MKILLRGNDTNITEFQSRVGDSHDVLIDPGGDSSINPSDFEAVFDFTISDTPENLQVYTGHNDVAVVANTILTSLAEARYMTEGSLDAPLIGFNGLPTFFDRDLLEVTVDREENRVIAENLGKSLGFETIFVEDRAGMVTPRVICMIINEAYYTTMEGTATRGDIDTAMKLGTNYPFGPFEWASRIGIQNVFELLEAVYEDTKDERYKICPMLKREYLELG